MTKNPFRRIANICAAAGITAAEFREFVRAVSRDHPEEAAKLYNNVRRSFKSFEQASEYELVSSHDQQEDLITEAVIADILRLVEGQGIDNPSAVRLLSDELLRLDSRLDRDDLTFSVKEGIRRWLARMIRLVGESTVLSAAVIAFSNAGGRDSHWRLSK